MLFLGSLVHRLRGWRCLRGVPRNRTRALIKWHSHDFRNFVYSSEVSLFVVAHGWGWRREKESSANATLAFDWLLLPITGIRFAFARFFKGKFTLFYGAFVGLTLIWKNAHDWHTQPPTQSHLLIWSICVISFHTWQKELFRAWISILLTAFDLNGV